MKEIRQAFAALDAWKGEPVDGLLEQFSAFLSCFTPLGNVDVLIQDHRRCTLLTSRQDENSGADWRRERGHFVSLVYHCRLLGPPDLAFQHVQGEPRRDQWALHAGCPPDLMAAQARYRRFF